MVHNVVHGAVLMAGHLRRRSGIWWFRRRVPDALVGRLGCREVQRSLKTSNSWVATARAKGAWLTTETAFRQMSTRPTLAAAQALLLIDQLLQENLFESPTADDLVEAWARGDRALTKQINRDVVDVVMSLPDEERTLIGSHMDRIASRIEIDFLRRKTDWEDTKAQAALL